MPSSRRASAWRRLRRALRRRPRLQHDYAARHQCVPRRRGKFNGTTRGLAPSRNYSPELRAQLLAGVPARALAANPDIEPQRGHPPYDRRRRLAGGPIVPRQAVVCRDLARPASRSLHPRQLRSRRHAGARRQPDVDDASAKVSWQVNRTAQLWYFNNLQYKLIGHRGGGSSTTAARGNTTTSIRT